MAVTVNYNLGLTIDETVTLSPVAGAVTFTNTTATAGKLDASSTVPATKCFNDTFDLAAGAATLDLTALAYTSGELDNVDATGLKLQACKVSCPDTNTAEVIMSKGAANAYNPFGEDQADADQITIEAGDTHLAYHPDTLADVSGTEKDIDFASTDLDATVTIEMVFG